MHLGEEPRGEGLPRSGSIGVAPVQRGVAGSVERSLQPRRLHARLSRGLAGR